MGCIWLFCGTAYIATAIARPLPAFTIIFSFIASCVTRILCCCHSFPAIALPLPVCYYKLAIARLLPVSHSNNTSNFPNTVYIHVYMYTYRICTVQYILKSQQSMYIILLVLLS